MRYFDRFNRPAPRLALLTGCGTLLVILAIRLIALNGYEGLTPIFFRLLILQDDLAGMAMLLMIIAAAFLAGRFDWLRMATWIGYRPLGVALVTTLVVSAGALLVYRNTRLSMDEYLVYFQSQIFASGHLAGRFPPNLKELLEPIGFLAGSSESGVVASPYLPGFALILTPFTIATVPWACNAVLTGLTVLVVHRLAMRLYENRTAAGLAVLLTLASPVILANGISYYSLTACMLANATFALLLLSETTARQLVLAGFIGSVALTLHSPVRHVPFAIPWLIWLALRPHPFRNLTFIGMGYLPLTLLLGAGWFGFIHQIDELAPDELVHSRMQAIQLPTAELLYARTAALAKLWVWAVPGLLLMAWIGLWRHRRNSMLILLTACFMCQFGGYLFVTFDQGHGWGYRYVHSAWFVLPLLAAAIALPGRPHSSRAEVAGADVLEFNLVASLAAVSLCAGLLLRGVQMRSFIDEHRAQQPQYASHTEHVVFIDTSGCFYCVDLIQNHPTLSDGVVRMTSQGSSRNAGIVARHWPGMQMAYSDRFGEVYESVPDVATLPRGVN